MKFGLGESYERVDILSTKTRGYLDLTKPASSLGVGGAYFLGSIFYFMYVRGRGVMSIPGEELISIIFVSFTMFLAHSASQAMNMAEDAEMDRNTPHKSNRPIPSGIVSEEEARSIAWILSAVALGRAYLVNWRFGVFATVLIFMGIFYNLDPLRVKERIIGIPWQAVSRGLLTFPAIWAAYGNPLSLDPWIFSLILFLYVLGFQNSADIVDRDVDEKYGVSTFVVEFGVVMTAAIALCCTGIIMIIIGVTTITGILPWRFLSLTLIFPLCLYMVYTMVTHSDTISSKTGNHPSWLQYYAGMVLIVVLLLGTEALF